MLAILRSAAVFGVDAHLVRVEADTANGFPKFTMLGLPDCAIKESEGRIRAALRNCGYDFKWDRRITVNMAPASLRKAGSSYDLATAMGLLAADGAVSLAPLTDVLLFGELALDGAVRPVSGLLPMMLMARRQGIAAAVVPSKRGSIFARPTRPPVAWIVYGRIARSTPSIAIASSLMSPARSPRCERISSSASGRSSKTL